MTYVTVEVVGEVFGEVAQPPVQMLGLSTAYSIGLIATIAMMTMLATLCFCQSIAPFLQLWSSGERNGNGYFFLRRLETELGTYMDWLHFTPGSYSLWYTLLPLETDSGVTARVYGSNVQHVTTTKCSD